MVAGLFAIQLSGVIEVRSAWESALFFSTGGVVAWALERIEIN